MRIYIVKINTFDQVTVRSGPTGTWPQIYVQLWTEFDIPSVSTRWANTEVLSRYQQALAPSAIMEIEFYVGSSKLNTSMQHYHKHYFEAYPIEGCHDYSEILENLLECLKWSTNINWDTTL